MSTRPDEQEHACPPVCRDALRAPLRRDAERNRQRILKAAREVFADEGLGAPLERVAQRAGVGIGTLYRRFPDRDALIDALTDDYFERLIDVAREALRNKDAWRGLVEFLECFLGIQAVDRGLKDLARRGRGWGEFSQMVRDRLVPLIAELVTRAQQQGTLRADVTVEDFPFIGAMVSGVIETTGQIAPDLWRRYLQIVLDGLRADGAGPTALPAPALAPDTLREALR